MRGVDELFLVVATTGFPCEWSHMRDYSEGHSCEQDEHISA